MRLPLAQLLQDNPEPLCVAPDTLVSDALALMIENDYSQLPIVDAQGHLLGLVSEQTIARKYFHMNAAVSLLDLDVTHCQVPAITMAPEDDVSIALTHLKTAYAIVVVKDKRPHRILTTHDTTRYFYTFSRSLVLLETIEKGLRAYIESVLVGEKELEAGLLRAFGADKKDPTRPNKDYDELSLWDHIRLITTDEAWPKFEPFLGPKALLLALMDEVRQIRNQQMHFRGEVEPVQFDALIAARDWLDTRPKPAGRNPAPQTTVHVLPADVPESRPAGKYGALEDWLVRQKAQAQRIRVSFNDIQELLGDALPQSAFEQKTWWANDSVGHVQSRAWLRAGWQVEDVDLGQQEVVFKQSLYGTMQVFFADLLHSLKEARPGLTRATRVANTNWISIGAGKTGFSFSWTFADDENLWIQLYIDTGDRTRNKDVFARLKAQQADIEAAFGSELRWDALENKRASRVYAAHPVRLHDAPDRLAPVREWALEAGLRFIDVFQPRVREL